MILNLFPQLFLDNKVFYCNWDRDFCLCLWVQTLFHSWQLYIYLVTFSLAHINRHTLMDPSVMRRIMRKDAVPASYFLLVKNGNSSTSLQTKNTFPLTGHLFTVSSPELEAQMHETQKISAGLFRTSHVPNQTHNSFAGSFITLHHAGSGLSFCFVASAATVTSERSPGPCATGNVDLCSFDSRVKHFLHSAGSAATHAVLSVSPQLVQGKQKCLEEQGETHGLGGSMKTGSDG